MQEGFEYVGRGGGGGGGGRKVHNIGGAKGGPNFSLAVN